MNSNLANQLLASVMKWDAPTLASERAALEFMGSMKYDAYDRYMPGMRFMSSLVQWLSDIKEEDRDEAYKFIKEKLVFISSMQMNYLVDLLYDSKIRPILLDMATIETDMPSYKRSSKVVRTRFEIEKRSALVIGLSDGAHTDILRRSAGFNNEQVLTNYYPDGKKLEDMLNELRKDEKLKEIEKPFFRRIFLIDDFTASGKSFIRYDVSDGEYHGKLKKIINELCTENEKNNEGKADIKHMSYLLAPMQEKIQIDILFCIATEKAKNNIKSNLNDYLKSVGWQDKVEFNIHIVQLLEDKLSNDIKIDNDLMKVLKKEKHFVEECVISKSYKVGKNDSPWLGFDECALPVVLAHNTPNNSLPIIWQDAERFHGLFPRISRH
uniref:PRTase-CE domain-containing protein n=1 Tax=Prevotella sp. GTC17254 TaxID=3236794 RepID=A0AB33J8N2_9BACT